MRRLAKGLDIADVDLAAQIHETILGFWDEHHPEQCPICNGTVQTWADSSGQSIGEIRCAECGFVFLVK